MKTTETTEATETAAVAEQGANVAQEKASSKKGANQKKGAPKGQTKAKGGKAKAAARKKAAPKKSAKATKTAAKPAPKKEDRIAAARADISRLKAEKEAFEHSNPPDGADEEELVAWNYVKELERQIRELKTDHRDELRDLARREKTAARARATDSDRQAASEARAVVGHVLTQLQEIDVVLAPYEQIKTDLAEARARYADLTSAFLNELRNRCTELSDAAKATLVLELCAHDLRNSLDAAVGEKKQAAARFIEGLWQKYSSSFGTLVQRRERVSMTLLSTLGDLGYDR